MSICQLAFYCLNMALSAILYSLRLRDLHLLFMYRMRIGFAILNASLLISLRRDSLHIFPRKKTPTVEGAICLSVWLSFRLCVYKFCVKLPNDVSVGLIPTYISSSICLPGWSVFNSSAFLSVKLSNSESEWLSNLLFCQSDPPIGRVSLSITVIRCATQYGNL